MTINSVKKLRIFISSPGDVGRERESAARVTSRLGAEVSGRVELEPYFWEHEPMHAGADFQGQIPPLADFTIFVGILWSRLGTRLHSSHARADGSSFASGTEFEFETALEAYRTSTTKTPRLLIYKRDETPLFPAEPPDVLADRTRQWQALQAFVGAWFKDPQDGGTFRAAFNTYKNTAEFEERLELHLRSVIQDLCPESKEPTAAAALPPVTWTKGSPYRGLKVFEFDHASIFFGRTRAIDEVVGQLRDRANVERMPFVLIFGSSGSGKSSLLRAGVIPSLLAGGIDGVGLWRRAIMQPSQSGGDLFDGLAAALLKPDAVPELAVGARTAADLAERLRKNASAIGQFLAGALPQAAQQQHEREKEALREEARALARDRPADADQVRRLADQLRFPEPRLILGLDQLEEIFTHDDRFPADSRIAFIAAIESLVRSGYVWVVATLRSDHFARCEEIPQLVKLQEGKGQYHLLPPSKIELGQIIRLPAQAAGVRFEDHPVKGRLEDVLRDAAADDPGALPLLEFSLEQLYQTGALDRVLTHDEYTTLGGAQGGLRGVLVKMANDIHGRLSAGGRAAFPTVFRRLVSIGSAGTEAGSAAIRFSRRNAKIGSLRERSAGEREVIETFLEARLLVTDKSDDGEEVLSVAHEALLNEWPLLRKMLEDEVAYLRRRKRVAVAAAEWDREKRDPARLATSVLLAEARLVRETEGADLSRIERDFVTLSLRRYRRRTVQLLIGAAALVGIFAALAVVAANRKREAEHLLSVSLFSRAQQLFEKDEAPGAIAVLADAIDLDPNGAIVAGDRLWFALTQRAWPIPITAEMKHRGPIASACFSPDGKRVLTASLDKTARLWDAATGSPLGDPMLHEKLVRQACFSIDGRRVLTASLDAKARLWDAATGKQIAGWIAEHDNAISAAAFSSGGRYVATGSQDGTARVWEAGSGKLVAELSHGENVHTLAFHPTDESLLLTVSGKVARLWRLPEGGEPALLKHDAAINSARFNPAGDRVITGDDDGTVRLWETPSGKSLGDPLKASALQTDAKVSDVKFSPNGAFIAAAAGNKVVLWKSDGTPLHEHALEHRDTVRCICFSPDSLRLLTGTADGRVQAWNVLTSGTMSEPIREGGAIVALEFSRDGKGLLVATHGGVARVWRPAPLHPASDVLPQGAKIEAIAIGEGHLLAACGDGKARLWDIATHSLTATLEHPEAVLCAAMGANEKYIVTGSADSTVRIWRSDTGKPLGDPLPQDGEVRSVQVSPDSKTFAAGTLKGTAGIWSLPEITPLGEPISHKAQITSVSFSRDNNLILTTSEDFTAKLSSTQTGELKAVLQCEREVKCGALAGSGRGMLIATGSADGTAQIWDGAGVPRSERLRHKAPVVALAFSPDEGTLATASQDGTAALWNTTGKSAGNALQHSESVNTVAFSPDSSRVATGSDDGSARVWNVPGGEPLSEPLWHSKPVGAVAWGSDGRALFSSSGSEVRVWDTATGLTAGDRRFLAKFARAFSSATVDISGRLSPHVVEPLAQLQAIGKNLGKGSASSLSEWFFADPTRRALTPFSLTNVPNYIEARISEGTPASLDEASLLAEGDAVLHERIENRRRKKPAAQ